MRLANTLLEIQKGLSLLYPELGIIGGIVLLLLVDLFLKSDKGNLFKYVTLLILIVTAILSFKQYCPLIFGQSLFGQKLHLSKSIVLFKVLFQFSSIGFTLFAICDHSKLKHENRVEYFVLLLGVLLGAHLMVMSRNLLVTFIGIELVSLSSYVLTAIDKDRKEGFEGSMKYLIFGAVSSAVMLYGMSWIYGLSGSLDYNSFHYLINQQNNWFVILLIFFVIVGFLFKIGAVPMHSWVPDVYQSAPNAVVSFFAVVPKLAGIGVLYHFLSSIPEEVYLTKIITIISITSICVGNLGAFWQKDVKRMLAYSSIAHAGFLLIGVVVFSEYGMKTILFYGFMLLFANLGAFFLIQVLSKSTNSTQLESFSGLGKKIPLIGVAATIIMATLTGLPPTVGFSAKLLLFSGLWESYQDLSNPLILALFIIGLVNTVFGLFYYIKLPYYLFFKESTSSKEISLTVLNKIFIILLVIPLLFLFIKSDWLFNVL